jgi:sulfate adenylyltransferase subunit 1 (EFTu-like GTPase family)
MKKIISLLALFVIFSCEKENRIEKSISEYVQTNFKNPASYEKISIMVLDTVTVGDEIKKEKAGYQESIKKLEQKNDELRKGSQNGAVVAYLKDNVNELKNYNKLIAERCKDSSSTEAKYYRISHKYRANNSFGAKELFNDIISMNKDYVITASQIEK